MLTFLIPSKTVENLDKLFRSFVDSSGKEGYRIVVGDNGIDRLPNVFAPGTFMKVPDPFVFARSVNISAGYADKDSDLVILNDDVEILSPNFVGSVEKALERAKKEGIGILSPIVEGGIGNPDQAQELDENQIVLTKKPICFVCAAIPREVWNKVGQMDETFTGYGFEDTDYSRRVVEAGYKLAVTGAARIKHGNAEYPSSGTFAKQFGDKKRHELFEKSHKIFMDKWGDGPQLGVYEIEETKFPKPTFEGIIFDGNDPMLVPDLGYSSSVVVSQEPESVTRIIHKVENATVINDRGFNPMATWAKSDFEVVRTTPESVLAIGRDQDIETDTELLWSLVNCLQPQTIVELGTRQAISTRIFADAAPGSAIYAVDPDPSCKKFIEGVACEWFQMTGEEFFGSREFGFKMDFCFVDTDPHTFEQTTMWLGRIDQFLKPGGAAAFHDIVQNRPEIQVKEAVRAWVKDRPEYCWVEYEVPERNYKWPQGGVGILWKAL